MKKMYRFTHLHSLFLLLLLLLFHNTSATIQVQTRSHKLLRTSITLPPTSQSLRLLRCRNFGSCADSVSDVSPVTSATRSNPAPGALVAPWERLPAPQKKILAETFILERVSEDSAYETQTYVRTYSLHRVNSAMHAAFCDGPASQKCDLSWQKCTTCGASWYLVWWMVEGSRLFTRAAYVDPGPAANALQTIIMSQQPAVELSGVHIDILVPYACRPEKLIDFADRVSGLRDLTFVRISKSKKKKLLCFYILVKRRM